MEPEKFFELIALLAFLVFLHQIGHFAAARIAGVHIEKPWLGIRGWYHSGHPSAFGNKPLIVQIAVLLAGSGGNVAAATLMFCVSFASTGVPHMAGTNEIVTITGGRPADRAGILPGDRVTSINGKRIESAEEASRLIKGSNGRTLKLTIERSGEESEIVVRPEPILLPTMVDGNMEFKRQYGIGVKFGQEWEFRRMGVLRAVVETLRHTYHTIKRILVTFRDLVIRPEETPRRVGGTDVVVREMDRAAKTGMNVFLLGIAAVNINFAMINLLPIPGLDGAKILFRIYDRIHARLFGHPIVPKKEIFIQILLCVVVLVVGITAIRFV